VRVLSARAWAVERIDLYYQTAARARMPPFEDQVALWRPASAGHLIRHHRPFECNPDKAANRNAICRDRCRDRPTSTLPDTQRGSRFSRAATEAGVVLTVGNRSTQRRPAQLRTPAVRRHFGASSTPSPPGRGGPAHRFALALALATISRVHSITRNHKHRAPAGRTSGRLQPGADHEDIPGDHSNFASQGRGHVDRPRSTR